MHSNWFVLKSITMKYLVYKLYARWIKSVVNVRGICTLSMGSSGKRNSFQTALSVVVVW